MPRGLMAPEVGLDVAGLLMAWSNWRGDVIMRSWAVHKGERFPVPRLLVEKFVRTLFLACSRVVSSRGVV